MKKELFEKAYNIDSEIWKINRKINLSRERIRCAIAMMKSGSMIDVKLERMTAFDDLRVPIKDSGIIKYLGNQHRELYQQLRTKKQEFENL